MKYIIGVDIGTTSTKSVLYNMNGEIIEKSSAGYKLYQDTPDMAEEDPNDIFSAVLQTINNVMVNSNLPSADIVGVSFSAAMHSLILMDDKGNNLTKTITWADNRAASYGEELKSKQIGFKIYEKTGTPIHAMTPLSKIIWIKNEYPMLFGKTYKFIDIKTYVFYKLFGVYKMDYSMASSTGLFNIREFKWEKLALAQAGITKNKLPDLVETTDCITGLDEFYAKQMNLLMDTAFIYGSSDGILSNLGLGAFDSNTTVVTIGTSGAVRKIVDKPITDPQGKLFCYVLNKNKWVIGGSVNSGGIVIDWLRSTFVGNDGNLLSYEEINRIAQNAPPGSDGLLFYPYLVGERAPIWDSYACGSYFGLNMKHNKSHLVRSAIEGTIYNLYSVLLMIDGISGKTSSIRATGGFSKSELWKHCLADIFEYEIDIPENYESSCLGAALLGMKSMGYLNVTVKVKSMIGKMDKYEPFSSNFLIYRKLMLRWVHLCEVFEPEYRKMTSV